MNFLRKFFEILAGIGFLILMGSVGTMEARPEYPLNTLIVQAIVGMIMMIPMLIYERWWVDEDY